MGAKPVGVTNSKVCGGCSLTLQFPLNFVRVPTYNGLAVTILAVKLLGELQIEIKRRLVIR